MSWASCLIRERSHEMPHTLNGQHALLVVQRCSAPSRDPLRQRTLPCLPQVRAPWSSWHHHRIASHRQGDWANWMHLKTTRKGELRVRSRGRGARPRLKGGCYGTRTSLPSGSPASSGRRPPGSTRKPSARAASRRRASRQTKSWPHGRRSAHRNAAASCRAGGALSGWVKPSPEPSLASTGWCLRADSPVSALHGQE